ncbi:uncharacterized protein [Spinacia oleracea]|uniref:RNase H type-1 domain-containing protein n=1 Tax=Spinacia oleracea TaxID=3562 RepID=A0ABM3R3L2_SPIOL|nr:uncharacterized protein LOC130465454 [Spinacia oleracea]
MSIHQLQDLILMHLSWWIKGWGDHFPYYSEEIIRNPTCLTWAFSNGVTGVNPRVNRISGPQSLWNPPILGHLKWNVDASFKSSTQSSAIRGVLQDSNGLFKCIFSSPVPPIEINGAEVLAIYRAIQISVICETINGHPIIVEYDSVNAVRWCNEDSGGPWNLNFQLNFLRIQEKAG